MRVDFNNNFVEVWLWLPSLGQLLSHRLEIGRNQIPNLPVSQMVFTNWHLDSPIKDAAFAFQGPNGCHQIGFADFVPVMNVGTLPSVQGDASTAALLPVSTPMKRAQRNCGSTNPVQQETVSATRA